MIFIWTVEAKVRDSLDCLAKSWWGTYTDGSYKRRMEVKLVNKKSASAIFEIIAPSSKKPHRITLTGISPGSFDLYTPQHAVLNHTFKDSCHFTTDGLQYFGNTTLFVSVSDGTLDATLISQMKRYNVQLKKKTESLLSFGISSFFPGFMVIFAIQQLIFRRQAPEEQRVQKKPVETIKARDEDFYFKIDYLEDLDLK